MSAEDLLEAGVLIYLQSLGIVGGGVPDPDQFNLTPEWGIPMM